LIAFVGRHCVLDNLAVSASARLQCESPHSLGRDVGRGVSAQIVCTS